MEETLLSLAAPVLIVGVAVLIIVTNMKRMKRMRAKNYQWYLATYPDAVKGKRVACHSCGHDHVQVRNVMQRTFMREHFCGQCGESLYYSPEGKA
jgi:ABC-type nickel/cobalt efflux system permease component RcnA